MSADKKRHVTWLSALETPLSHSCLFLTPKTSTYLSNTTMSKLVLSVCVLALIIASASAAEEAKKKGPKVTNKVFFDITIGTICEVQISLANSNPSPQMMNLLAALCSDCMAALSPRLLRTSVL